MVLFLAVEVQGFCVVRKYESRRAVVTGADGGATGSLFSSLRSSLVFHGARAKCLLVQWVCEVDSGRRWAPRSQSSSPITDSKRLFLNVRSQTGSSPRPRIAR